MAEQMLNVKELAKAGVREAIPNIKLWMIGVVAVGLMSLLNFLATVLPGHIR